MESQSDDFGTVTVSIDPEEQINITTQNNGTITTRIIALSEDKASLVTASGDSIKIDEIAEIYPPITSRIARFISGIALAAGDLAITVAGGGGNKNPPLTFTYINGSKCR
ncbi:hypothetical protein AZH11_22025 [Pseudomonas simiae]|nr:hypothetical protein AZH11_22025 [Pseudomonas simiae]